MTVPSPLNEEGWAVGLQPTPGTPWGNSQGKTPATETPATASDASPPPPDNDPRMSPEPIFDCETTPKDGFLECENDEPDIQDRTSY